MSQFIISPANESMQKSVLHSNRLVRASLLNRVQVIPLTKNTGRLYPSKAIVVAKARQWQIN